jgi:hypothetical protein
MVFVNRPKLKKKLDLFSSSGEETHNPLGPLERANLNLFY